MNKERGVLLGEFESLLRREAGFYVSLIELTKREQKALIKNNLEEIEAVTRGIENMTVELRKSENARSTYLKEMKDHMPASNEELTVSMLIAAVEEPFRSRLQALYKELAARMKEVHYLNEYNASLVRHSMEYTHYLLSLFTGTPGKQKVYSSNGMLNNGDQAKLLDSKA